VVWATEISLVYHTVGSDVIVFFCKRQPNLSNLAALWASATHDLLTLVYGETGQARIDQAAKQHGK